MNFDYTSAHARVLDGVRTARYRALAESRLPQDEFNEHCVLHHGSDIIPADALWVHAPSGRISPLCESCVNRWLDDADEAADEDPPALVPMRNRRRP